MAATTPTPAPPPNPPAAEPAPRRAARNTWALLLARIDEVFPLVGPTCGGAMRIIAFITAAATARGHLAHLGAPTAPPRIAPARGPPRWKAADAECVDPGRPWNPSAQPEPASQFDQRIAW